MDKLAIAVIGIIAIVLVIIGGISLLGDAAEAAQEIYECTKLVCENR